jgi:hypothetical protein
MSRAYEDMEDGWEFMNMDYFMDEDLGWEAEHNLDT